MRIGFITHWYDPEGGSAAAPGTIARALADRGHDVHVVTGFPIYPQGRVFSGYRIRPYQREVMRGVTVHRLPMFPSHDSRAIGRFANYGSFAASAGAASPAVLATMDVNFVYSTPATVALAALTSKWLRQTPFVVQIQDIWPQTVTASGLLSDSTAQKANRILNVFCDRVYRSAHSIAVTSPGMRDLIESRRIPSDKIHFLPNWADEASFQPVPRSRALAQELGLDRQFTVMYAGNLGEMQDLMHVVEAAERLQDLGDLQIAFVGSGVMERRLHEAVRSKSLNNVRFVPAQPFERMSDILALGDIQLVTLKDKPLYRSTLPSKLQANLAAGRPILGSVGGDAAHVITQSGAGSAVTPGDFHGLAKEIRRFHSLPPHGRRELESASLAYYNAHFSKNEITDKLESLLASAATEGRR